jgi:hypothetical protein
LRFKICRPYGTSDCLLKLTAQLKLCPFKSDPRCTGLLRNLGVGCPILLA